MNGDIIRPHMVEGPAEIHPHGPDPAPRGAHSLREAQEFCAGLVRRHYENFPVASRLLPASIRPAVQAIYAFARMADDFADEPAHAGHRLERLDEWARMLEECFRGFAVHPVFIALREAIRRHGLPAQPFRDLLEAFRIDVTCARHPDFAALLRYCRLSADPVGRLILHLFGYTDPVLVGRSNAVCTALQLTNHWQDIAIDLTKGRIYLPADERAECGVSEDDLLNGRITDGFRRLMAEQIARTRSLYEAGRPLCDAVRGRLRLELRLTWLGGQRVLSLIEAVDYDVFTRRPRLGALDGLALFGQALAWAA